MSSLDHFLGKLVLVDLNSYSISGKLLSARGDDLTLQTRGGSRILINRLETRAIRELAGGKRRCKA